MHFSALTCVVLSIVLGSVNVVAEEKRCDGNNCAENLERRSYYGGYSSAGYAQSVYAPYSSAVYYSSVVAPVSSYYPSYSSYYPQSSYVASSYGPQSSGPANHPQSSRPHSGGNHRRPHGGSNGGHNAAHTPTPGPKGSAASSISSKSGGAFLALGVLTGVVAYVL